MAVVTGQPPIDATRIARAAIALDEEARYRYERSARLETEGDRVSAAFAKQRGRELQETADGLRGGRS